MEVESCDWLYDKETDYFVKAHLEETNVEVIFVRSKGGWFSMNWDSGRLDIDGSLTFTLENE